jgi:hypothetical protein
MLIPRPTGSGFGNTLTAPLDTGLPPSSSSVNLMYTVPVNAESSNGGADRNVDATSSAAVVDSPVNQGSTAISMDAGASSASSLDSDVTSTPTPLTLSTPAFSPLPSTFGPSALDSATVSTSTSTTTSTSTSTPTQDLHLDTNKPANQGKSTDDPGATGIASGTDMGLDVGPSSENSSTMPRPDGVYTITYSSAATFVAKVMSGTSGASGGDGLLVGPSRSSQGARQSGGFGAGGSGVDREDVILSTGTSALASSRSSSSRVLSGASSRTTSATKTTSATLSFREYLPLDSFVSPAPALLIRQIRRHPHPMRPCSTWTPRPLFLLKLTPRLPLQDPA